MVKAAYLRASAIELDLYIERVQKLLVEIIAQNKGPVLGLLERGAEADLRFNSSLLNRSSFGKIRIDRVCRIFQRACQPVPRTTRRYRFRAPVYSQSQGRKESDTHRKYCSACHTPAAHNVSWSKEFPRCRNPRYNERYVTGCLDQCFSHPPRAGGGCYCDWRVRSFRPDTAAYARYPAEIRGADCFV